MKSNQVLAEQSIDFTRHDAGWIFWLVFPLFFLTTLRKKDFANGGKKALQAILGRLLWGLALALLIMGLFSVWYRVGPQYFTRLRFGEGKVALIFQGSGPEKVIPLQDVRNLSVVKSGTLRHPCRRLKIETADASFRSFGFDRLDDDQIAVLDAIRKEIAATMPSGQ